MANGQRAVDQQDLGEMMLCRRSRRDGARGVESRRSNATAVSSYILITDIGAVLEVEVGFDVSGACWTVVERVPYGLAPWGGREGDIEFGGVGRGWFFVTGTLLAATAAKLSRPPVGFGISRAVDAMLAISLEGASYVSL